MENGVMTKGRRLLSQYLAFTGESQRYFAGRSGVNEATVCLWLKGLRCPDLVSGVRVEEATGRYVPVAAWTVTETPTDEAPWSAEAGEPEARPGESPAGGKAY